MWTRWHVANGLFDHRDPALTLDQNKGNIKIMRKRLLNRAVLRGSGWKPRVERAMGRSNTGTIGRWWLIERNRVMSRFLGAGIKGPRSRLPK